MTEQRRVIARVLADSDDHPDVEELYRRCAERRREHLDLHRLSHRQAVRGCRHHRAPRLPRRPRALRADSGSASRPPDQPAHRPGDRVPVRGDREAAGRGGAQARLQAGRSPARALRRAARRQAAAVMYQAVPQARLPLRLRGEVGDEVRRVRGSIRELRLQNRPLTPTLSPQAGKRSALPLWPTHQRNIRPL